MGGNENVVDFFPVPPPEIRAGAGRQEIPGAAEAAQLREFFRLLVKVPAYQERDVRFHPLQNADTRGEDFFLCSPYAAAAVIPAFGFPMDGKQDERPAAGFQQDFRRRAQGNAAFVLYAVNGA